MGVSNGGIRVFTGHGKRSPSELEFASLGEPARVSYRVDLKPRSRQTKIVEGRYMLSYSAAQAALAFAAMAEEPLRFEIDSNRPGRQPNDWIAGQASGIAVDAHDNVRIVQRTWSPFDQAGVKEVQNAQPMRIGLMLREIRVSTV